MWLKHGGGEASGKDGAQGGDPKGKPGGTSQELTQ